VTSSVPSSSPGGPPGPAAAVRGFRPLLALRALTVVNDNLARWLVIGLGKRAAAAVGTAPAAVLALGTVLYVLPFILMAWLAGWLADRFMKRSVVVAGKFAEIGIAVVTAAVVGWGAATGSVYAGLPVGLWLLLGTIGLFSIQTTLLNPSLIGTIPETSPAAGLSAANGVFALVSLAATLVGMAAGNGLADATWLSPLPDPEQPLPTWLGALGWGHAAPAAIGLVGVAIAGWVCSLWLPRIPPASATCPFPRNALAATFRDLGVLAGSRRLAAAAGGIVYFWAMGAVVQLNIDQYAFESGATRQTEVVPLLVALVGGIGAGSVIAGRASRRGIDPDSRVDLGLVPLGGILMGLACFALALSDGDIFTAGTSPVGLAAPVLWLGLLGIGAGMFDVPLEAYLQEQSPPERRGTVLASTNLLVFAGMLVASIAYYGLRVPVGPEEAARPLLSARAIFALFGLLSCAAIAVALVAAPRASLRLFVGLVVNAVWRYRVRDAALVPERGPAVIVANHVSWLDGFLLPLSAPRPVRMVVYGPNIRGRFLGMLADQWRFILFDPKPKSIGRALRTIQAGIAAGDCVGIFCEGGISRNGQLLGFKRGLDWLLARAEAPIVPASIDGMWGSRLSFSEGRCFTTWPRRQWHGGPRGLRRGVTLTFGRPLPVGTRPDEARLALQELCAQAVRRRMAGLTLPRVAITDAAAAAAEAEAFDGCCLVRRGDRLVTSLSMDDPLQGTLGGHGERLLGIPVTRVAADATPRGLHDALTAARATIWLARVEQVAALAADPDAARLAAHLDAIVMPLARAGDLAAARDASERFHAATGVEPVTAYAPPEAGGLVAMNTPPTRRGGVHETTRNAASVGRVVSGAVVWPEVALRARLGLADLADIPVGSAATLAVGATLPRPDGAASPLPRAVLLADRFRVDDDGFLIAEPT
jgi:acyl-[acyl-carrier-protein]-phospholipid O-acyltransferase/long-chain-fatty-acid--[acyl-carrier-protein] ligase